MDAGFVSLLGAGGGGGDVDVDEQAVDGVAGFDGLGDAGFGDVGAAHGVVDDDVFAVGVGAGGEQVGQVGGFGVEQVGQFHRGQVGVAGDGGVLAAVEQFADQFFAHGVGVDHHVLVEVDAGEPGVVGQDGGLAGAGQPTQHDHLWWRVVGSGDPVGDVAVGGVDAVEDVLV